MIPAGSRVDRSDDGIGVVKECLCLAMESWVRVACFGACVRGSLLIIFLLFGGYFADYDTSNHLNLHGDCLSQTSLENQQPSPLLHRLVVWDSVYFLRIARCGYEFEQTHAFFPGFPTVIRYVALGIRRMWPLVDIQSSLSLAGLLVSNLCYVVSIVLFHRVSLRVLGSESLTALATILYTVPPSSVFMTGAYTEGLFCMCTMGALWALFCQESIWGGAVCIAASCMTRSNGVLHIGFLGHFALRGIVRSCLESNNRNRKVLIGILKLVAASCIAVFPLLHFQMQGYQRFCEVNNGLERTWCRKSVPSIYGFVQEAYWNVGFLRYFELKQIPNFLLAAPTLGLSFMGCYKYILDEWCRGFSLGLSPSRNNARGFYSELVAPFVYQWTFMAIYAFFVMYVQVATRFLSACPPFYWFIAHLLSRKNSKLAWLWFLSFAGLGSLMFPNFYPWT